MSDHAVARTAWAEVERAACALPHPEGGHAALARALRAVPEDCRSGVTPRGRGGADPGARALARRLGVSAARLLREVGP